MDGDGKGEGDMAAVVDMVEEKVPEFELPGDGLPAEKDKVNRDDGVGEVVKEVVAATEMVLVVEEVALFGGVFEAEGEEETVVVIIEVLLPQKDGSPLALALPEVVGKRGEDDGMAVELPLALTLNRGVLDAESVERMEEVPLGETDPDTEEKVEGVGVGVKCTLIVNVVDAVFPGLKVSHSRDAVAFAQGVGV